MIQANSNDTYPKTTMKGDILVISNIVSNQNKSKSNVKEHLKKQIKQTLDNTVKMLKTAKIEPKNIIQSKITLMDPKDKEIVFDTHKDYFLDKVDQKLEIEINELKEGILAEIKITAYLGFNG